MSLGPVLSYEDLLSLVESGKDLAAHVDPKALLKDILRRACHLTDSEGASILLKDDRTGGLYFADALGDGAPAILARYGKSSEQRVPIESKAGAVFRSGKTLVEASLEQDRDHFKGVDRDTGGTTRNMVCAAMAVNYSGTLKPLGVLQIINRKSGDYTERDRLLLEHFATQAAIAIRNSTMFSSLVAHMGFYALRDPLETMEELNRPPRSESLAVMFADMRGFTRLCQTIRSDQQVCDLLSEFMTMLADQVLAHDGMVNKKLGDGVMALFREPDAARKAVECAFSIEDRFEELQTKWAISVPEKIDFLDIGVGIVTAPVMLGAIGAGAMRDFTAIGTPVILAAAIEKAARGGKRILGDKVTYYAVQDLIEEQVDPAEFPLHKPDQPTITSYDVYELVRRKTPAEPDKMQLPIKPFLCHASEDASVVHGLYDRLRGDGVDPWLDKKDLVAGQEWAAVIPDAVRSADVVLVCISSRSVNKEGYLQKEIRYALDAADEKPAETIFVIPVRLEECTIPRQLSRWQWVDLFEADGYDRLLRSLRARAAALRAAAG